MKEKRGNEKDCEIWGGGGQHDFVGSTLAAKAPGSRRTAASQDSGQPVEWWQGVHLGQVPRGTQQAERYSRAGGLHQSRGMPWVAGGDCLVMEEGSSGV